MSRANQTGNFQFCVEMGLNPNQTALSQHRQLGVLAEMISMAFDRHGLKATWAVANPGYAFVEEAIKPLVSRHEVALLVDDSVLELRHRLLEAEERQLKITTLVLDRALSRDEQTQLAKNGISAVRPAAPAIDQRTFAKSPIHMSKRQGVLQFSASAVFPGTGRFLGAADPAYAGKHILHRAMKRGSAEQLSIRVAELLDSPSRRVKSLSKLLAHAARLQQAGRIQVETIRTAARRCCPNAGTASARSILKPAA